MPIQRRDGTGQRRGFLDVGDIRQIDGIALVV
jgi:hypothetical protein